MTRTTTTTRTPGPDPAFDTLPPGAGVHFAAERGATNLGWLQSRHAFSFGGFHDPARMAYRGLRVLNDDVVAPGAGFARHPHQDMEIITWVLDGAVRHGDSMDNTEVLRRGDVQVMSAGRGIVHSEHNDSGRDPVHFLQIWIEPDARGHEPRYAQVTPDPDARRGGWQMLAGGAPEADALPIHRDAAVFVTDLGSGQTVESGTSDGRCGYLHVATGAVTVNGRTLVAGDAVSVPGPASLRVTGGESGAQVLWFDLD